MGFQTVRQIRANRLAVSVSAMRAQAARYREFPKVNAVHALTDQIQANGVTFMIRALFTQKVLGWYGYTMRVLRTPLLFVGRSVSQALYQKASEVLHEGKDLHALVKRTMRQLAWIGLPVFGLIFLTAPPLFGFVFGENWREAGVYARLLSPWLYMNFIMSSLSQLPLLVGEQRKNFLISVGYNLLLMGLILAGYWMGDIKKGFLLVSIFMSLYIACMLRWYLVISRKKMTDSYSPEPFPPPDDAA
jgi:O-antigen/teichoic acid export membrane protein